MCELMDILGTKDLTVPSPQWRIMTEDTPYIGSVVRLSLMQFIDGGLITCDHVIVPVTKKIVNMDIDSTHTTVLLAAISDNHSGLNNGDIVITDIRLFETTFTLWDKLKYLMGGWNRPVLRTNVVITVYLDWLETQGIDSKEYARVTTIADRVPMSESGTSLGDFRPIRMLPNYNSSIMLVELGISLNDWITITANWTYHLHKTYSVSRQTIYLPGV